MHNYCVDVSKSVFDRWQTANYSQSFTFKRWILLDFVQVFGVIKTQEAHGGGSMMMTRISLLNTQ